MIIDDKEFIILDYKALIDEDDQKKELAEVNQKEAEVKAKAKKDGETCYL